MATGTERWSVTPISSLTALARWTPIWRHVLDHSPNRTLFLEPGWVLPWYELYQRPTRALLTGPAGAPVAAALLTLSRLWPAGPRVLRPPGLGVSDYLDLLPPASPTEAAPATDALLDWLLECGGWELLDLPNLPEASPTRALITAAAARRGLQCLLLQTHTCPYVDLSAGWSAYLATRSRKLQYNVRARGRQLANLGEVRFLHYRSPTAVAAALPRAVELHAHRWRGLHTSTTFSSSRQAHRFYRAACQRLAAEGYVDLATLELDDRLLAFALTFELSGRLLYYLPAFDPDYARYGPSTALLVHLLESACQRELREFDFMLGDEPYKSQWANGSRSTYRLVLAAPTAAGQAALGAFRTYLKLRERARRSPPLQRLRRYGWLGFCRS